MKYSIEIGKIIEGALKHDKTKVLNYAEQLIQKLEEDNESKTANRFNKLLTGYEQTYLSPMGANKNQSVPIDTESRTMLADIIYPNENNIEVILSKENTEKLESFILNYQYADTLNELGIGMSNSLLLYGPPGCGKTKSAYLIAKKLNLPLVLARLDSLISSYLGTTAKNIRALFEFAQKMPCVLFLDEFDAVAKARDDTNELGELKRVVNSLLQNVDSMSKDSLLLAATNHEYLLDPAVWRRFDFKLKIELPDKNAIIKIIERLINEDDFLSEKDKIELSLVLDGLSGANIEEIIKKALRESVIRNLRKDKSLIYNEIFSFKEIIPSNLTDDRQILSLKAKFLRNFDEKIFSLQNIADILGCSKSNISKIIK